MDWKLLGFSGFTNMLYCNTAQLLQHFCYADLHITNALVCIVEEIAFSLVLHILSFILSFELLIFPWVSLCYTQDPDPETIIRAVVWVEHVLYRGQGLTTGNSIYGRISWDCWLAHSNCLSIDLLADLAAVIPVIVWVQSSQNEKSALYWCQIPCRT